MEKMADKVEKIPKKPGPLGFVRSIFRILAGKPQVPPSLKDNPLLETILKRRSVRRFADREIPDDVFSAILEAGRLAPSTVNLQTWTFAVFTAQTWRETFGRPVPFKGQRAVMVLGDTHRDKQVMDVFPYGPLVEYTVAVMNASLAAMNMNLAAEALGVSSVMLSETGRSGFLDAGYLKQALELPDGVFPLMTIIFGYARGPYPPMPPKLPLEQICFEGVYREAEAERMEDWLSQMVAGYKASNPLSSFDAQLRVYQSKIGRAEADLKAIVFYDDGAG
jgi:nitroreductase